MGVLGTFLLKSGCELRAEPKEKWQQEIEQLVLDVVEDRMSFEQLHGWIEDHIQRRRNP